MSERAKLSVCDRCERKRSGSCNAVDVLKHTFKLFGDRYGIHGFFVIDKCSNFLDVGVGSNPTCGRCER